MARLEVVRGVGGDDPNLGEGLLSTIQTEEEVVLVLQEQVASLLSTTMEGGCEKHSFQVEFGSQGHILRPCLESSSPSPRTSW